MSNKTPGSNPANPTAELRFLLRTSRRHGIAAAPGELARVPLAARKTLAPFKPSGSSFVGYIVAMVANAIASSDWFRLKTCPDCQWAFYDHTRNGSKRWCGMTKGGPGGRACGTIAKVAAYRAREAAKMDVTDEAH